MYLTQNANVMYYIQKLKIKEFKTTYCKENHMANAFDDKLQVFDEIRNFDLTEQVGSILYDLLQIVLHFENHQPQYN